MTEQNSLSLMNISQNLRYEAVKLKDLSNAFEKTGNTIISSELSNVSRSLMSWNQTLRTISESEVIISNSEFAKDLVQSFLISYHELSPELKSIFKVQNKHILEQLKKILEGE